MASRAESRNRSVFSLGNLVKLVLTAAFLFWIYLIWNTTADLDRQLNSNTDHFAVVRNLQVEYKNEIQEWKNLLLRSNSRDNLDKNWRIFASQHLKVADAAKQGILHNDVRAINVKLNAFVEGHESNFLLYKKSAEMLAKQNFDPRQADLNVKGIDRPLLDILEDADAGMQDEKKNINDRLVAKARNRIEQSLIALVLMVLIVVWRPQH